MTIYKAATNQVALKIFPAKGGDKSLGEGRTEEQQVERSAELILARALSSELTQGVPCGEVLS